MTSSSIVVYNCSLSGPPRRDPLLRVTTPGPYLDSYPLRLACGDRPQATGQWRVRGRPLDRALPRFARAGRGERPPAFGSSAQYEDGPRDGKPDRHLLFIFPKCTLKLKRICMYNTHTRALYSIRGYPSIDQFRAVWACSCSHAVFIGKGRIFGTPAGEGVQSTSAYIPHQAAPGHVAFTAPGRAQSRRQGKQ